MNRTLISLTFALLAPLALLSLVACGGPDEPPAEVQQEAEPVAVTVQTAAYGSVGDEMIATGGVEASRRAMPGTKIMGRVDRVPVEEGQRVGSGALLAALERRDLEAAVRQAEAAVASAEAQLANAKAQYARIQELEAKGSATRKNLEDATSAFQMSEAGVAQAEANLEAARVTLTYAVVRSPFDGWVVTKRVEGGDMVQPGAPLFVVEDLDPVKVVAQIPETEVSRFAPGDQVTVEVASVGAHTVGEIARLVPSGDPRSRTFQVDILLDNPDGVLKSGMFARVVLAEKGTRKGLFVPLSAVVSRGQLSGLFVVDESGDSARARLRWVRLGGERGDAVEVISGLAEGERYVLDPPTGLVDGTPLSPRPAPSWTPADAPSESETMDDPATEAMR